MSAARYPAIGAHGLIGDRRTAALVSADGTIDWCCVPHFDGDIAFGALLDGTRGGRWRLGPRQALEGEQQYLDETALLLTRWARPEWELELLDAMLLPDGATDQPQHPALLRRLRCVRGVSPCVMELVTRLNFAAAVPVRLDTASGKDTPGGELHLWSSRQEVAALTDENDRDEFELREGDELWTVLSWGSAPQPPWRLEDARAALERTASSWRHWARLHPWLGPQRGPVLASQRVIRLLSDAQNGSQVAAPTTSLPERIGGDRNYDYRIAWVRDSSLALAILAVFGDPEAAEHYMDWLAGRPPGDEMPLKVLYRIDGSGETEERELQDVEGYRGSRPVRVGNHASEQFQLDSLGYLADCALIYLQNGGRWKPEYSRMVDQLADFTVANWQRRDHGIWELDEERHYVSSKAMGWVVLERACRIRKHLHDVAPAHWIAARDAIHADVMQRGWSESLQSFRQHYDSDHLDASALLLSLMDFLPGDHPRIVATVAAVQRDLQRDGFVWRFHPASLGHDDMPLDGLEAAFVPCTFWLASALARAGRADEARALIERVERSFGQRGLFSEEFDPRSGQALGNYPLLFSHAEHLRAVMDLAKASPLGMAGMLAGKAAGAIARAVQGE